MRRMDGQRNVEQLGAGPCAACGSRHSVRPDERCGNVPFCLDCSEWSRDLTEWDDIGMGD